MLCDFTRLVVDRHGSSASHSERIFILLAELANFRAAIQAGTIVDAGEILEGAAKTESQLRCWKASLPRTWKYESVSLSTPKAIVQTWCGNLQPYMGQYYVFTSTYHAVVWCGYFMALIMVGDVLLDLFKHADLADLLGTSFLRTHA